MVSYASLYAYRREHAYVTKELSQRMTRIEKLREHRVVLPRLHAMGKRAV
jgi:hypothetical protein